MVESFESYRSYLFAIAYRMLGSAMDAQDMVQETYLRYSATPKDSITSLKAFLTTIITRLCMDQLHLARRKRDVYLGPWLPEPIVTTTTLESINPEERVDMKSRSRWRSWCYWSSSNPSSGLSSCCVKSSSTTMPRLPPFSARVKWPVASGSAERRNILATTGHASQHLPTPTSSCSPGFCRRLRLGRWLH